MGTNNRVHKSYRERLTRADVGWYMTWLYLMYENKYDYKLTKRGIFTSLYEDVKRKSP